MIDLQNAPTRTDTGPLLLGAYAARTCPVKTQNAYDPTLSRPEGQPSDALAELFDGGADFEKQTVERLITQAPGRVIDLRLLIAESRGVQTEACLRAMASGAAVIIGGCLPVDRTGHRAGYPDLLVRGADTVDGRPAYHPAEVKFHKIIDRLRRTPAEEPESGLLCSTLRAPGPEQAARRPELALRIGSRWADLVQLAHYHRMLEACGYAAARPLAAVLGTDLIDGGPVLAWADLAEPVLRTFSRSSAEGWRLRSPLERYDHEHAFRTDIARRASARTGDPRIDLPPLVQPIVNPECARCQWWEHCRPQLHPDDVSLRIDKGPLDMREIAVLRRHGIATITDLVGADLDQLLEGYLPEVTHRQGAEARLRLAVRRARMIIAGTQFDREDRGPIQVPGAVVEIDLDIESSAEGRIYLWGFLVQRSGSEPVYHQFTRFCDLDPDGEAELAVEAFGWLRGLAETEDLAVYHYSSYEPNAVKTLAERTGDPTLTWAVGFAAEHFVDLLDIVKAHYFGASGLGLKLIAQHAGFSWRDDDPGGLNSQLWFRDAVHQPTAEARDQAATRVLEYNEDDVRATHRLRAWLRAQ